MWRNIELDFEIGHVLSQGRNDPIRNTIVTMVRNIMMVMIAVLLLMSISMASKVTKLHSNFNASALYPCDI
jgi:hypothetical protein